MEEYIFLYVITCVFGLVLIVKTIMIIPERQSYVIQRLGKYNRICNPGLNFKIPFIELIASKENLRIQQLDVNVETKTLDNVFVDLKISVPQLYCPSSLVNWAAMYLA